MTIYWINLHHKIKRFKLCSTSDPKTIARIKRIKDNSPGWFSRAVYLLTPIDIKESQK
jgi:hypothetical protein